jgi:general secretion pathway protein G
MNTKSSGMSGNETVGQLLRVWRARRARARGVTLVEVLIVVAIIAMVAGGVAVFALPKYKEAQIKNAETGARIVRTAVQQWQAANNETSCPTISQLVQ